MQSTTQAPGGPGSKLYGRSAHLKQLGLDSCTYDHRVWKTGLPVRSAVLKPHAGELVVGWVTTSESSLLYVFVFLKIFFVLWKVRRASCRPGFRLSSPRN
ncbi:L-lysine 2-3-aminomutase [Penicillium crustosum]|uniref:L-lysine 2-3-aminomutase n=1 Tax=Penicillium crustosum TaxID=36656 RepID=UPI0023A0D636|nr:L-lysine 2-3-aminomutase [Penicillium crustosum]KAJ5394217.1 L-lysine 2-3-aminomutase [Penicillium crustosum]